MYSTQPQQKAQTIESFFIAHDRTKIFVYEYVPTKNYTHTIFIISGITGINHTAELDIIEKLSNNENRVIVMHPRGTGYSEGTRGDLSNFHDFIRDYVDVIQQSAYSTETQQKVFLYGHSMSCAIALAVASELKTVAGLILINPPCIMKQAPGMSPSLTDYLTYIGYAIFAPHTPIVNMAGDPSKIENAEDKIESERRNNDPLLVKHFSMYCMFQTKKMMDAMVTYAKNANYPLLLVYGTSDSIVEKSGCDTLFTTWKSSKKNYVLIEGGPHGKVTVLKAQQQIHSWIANQ